LLERISAGDHAALALLYQRLGGAMYSLAYQIVGDPSSAEDVVQEVFIATWQNAGRYDDRRGSPASWMFGLTRHKAIDLLRRETTSRSRTVDADLMTRPAVDDVEQEAWLSYRRDQARHAMSTLSEDQRRAVELAFFGGLTHMEVAEVLMIPLGTAKYRIRMGLLRLRGALAVALQDQER
jgi:RNA polymerase sigma-70 factor (ECF subfamily)